MFTKQRNFWVGQQNFWKVKFTFFSFSSNLGISSIDLGIGFSLGTLKLRSTDMYKSAHMKSIVTNITITVPVGTDTCNYISSKTDVIVKYILIQIYNKLWWLCKVQNFRYMYKVTHRKPWTLHLYHSSKKILLDFTPSIICLNYFYTTQKHILQSFKGSELITRSWVHTSVFPLVHELVSLALSRLDSILPCLHREIPLFPL